MSTLCKTAGVSAMINLHVHLDAGLKRGEFSLSQSKWNDASLRQQCKHYGTRVSNPPREDWNIDGCLQTPITTTDGDQVMVIALHEDIQFLGQMS